MMVRRGVLITLGLEVLMGVGVAMAWSARNGNDFPSAFTGIVGLVVASSAFAMLLALLFNKYVGEIFEDEP